MDLLHSLNVHDQDLQSEERSINQQQRCFASFEKEVKELLARREALAIDQNENKTKKRKVVRLMEREPVVEHDQVDATERLQRFITGEMYGIDIKLVIEKKLYGSDLNANQNRLNMPIKQLKTRPDEFLTADEIRTVYGTKEGIAVRVVGPMLQMYEKSLWLKTWHMKHTDNFVLKTNWNRFVEEHIRVLKKDTLIQVWSFRKNRQLCFAIVPVGKPDYMYV
ncbi:hypothetical protein R6Q57_015255 [Mikania cordata]